MKNITFNEFRKGLSDAELEIFVRNASKRRNVYLLICIALYAVAIFFVITANTADWLYVPLFVIEILKGILSGFGCFANNMVRFVKSKGRKSGGIISVLLALLGGLIIPLVVIAVCRRSCPYKTVLGWNVDNAKQQVVDSNPKYQDGSNGHKLIDDLLDPNNNDPITLIADDGRSISFKQIALIPYCIDGKDELFVLL